VPKVPHRRMQVDMHRGTRLERERLREARVRDKQLVGVGELPTKRPPHAPG
jgi:hypothetical protein